MNILVISHPRSGTYFLLNTIAHNFGYDNNRINVPPVTDIEELKRFFSSATSKRIVKSYNNTKVIEQIFKSHHNFKVLEPILDIISSRFKIFYIIRDGRDVITSMFHWFKHTNRLRFPQPESISELLRLCPNNWTLSGDYDFKTAETFVHRWIEHVNPWYDYYLDNKDKVELVRYENLNSKIGFYGSVHSIGAFLDQTPRKDIIHPTLRDRGVFNRKGIIGDYKNYFTKEDCEFFDSIAKDTMIKLRYWN